MYLRYRYTTSDGKQVSALLFTSFFLQLWNLFDTAVAHRVAELQSSGASVVSSFTPSLNALCDAYAVAQNPLKGQMKRNLFLRVSELARPAELRQVGLFVLVVMSVCLLWL
jgi:hypothetical protein